MRTVQGKTFAWTSQYSCIGPNELKSGSDDQLVRGLQYATPDMSSSGWVKVGEVEVTITLFGLDDIVHGQVDALKAMKKEVIAKAEAEATRIEGEIQKLLAISYTAEA